MYLHVLNCGLCSFFVFPLGAFCTCRWLIFSSILKCFWKSLHYSLGWLILYPWTLSRSMTGCITHTSAVTALSYSATEGDWWPLCLEMCCTHPFWLENQTLSVFGIRDPFWYSDTQADFWFIYCFLFLNQLTLGRCVMVMSHVDISAQLHLSNISDLPPPPPLKRGFWFY